MRNKDYSRFLNTLEDLEDCRRHIKDTNLGRVEYVAREELIRCCMGILEDLGMEVEETGDY